MSIHVACLWCGARNDITKARMNNLAIYCRRCGHHADKTKRRCDCPPCLNAAARLSEKPSEPQQVELFGDDRSHESEGK